MDEMRRWIRLVAVALVAVCFSAALAGAQAEKAGQPVAARADQGTGHGVGALLVSDIHFDPFHDPGKAKLLAAAPVSEWRAILAAPATLNQEPAFEALQRSCYAHRADTPYPLLESALKAMRAAEPNAKFITVSGDLIAHGFFCRYGKTLPGGTAGDYQAFVLKTMEFVMGELRAAFPHVPVYVALGNNDTACDDYRLDAGSEFLRQAGAILAKGLPPAGQQAVASQFGAGGYYSVAMAEPMQGTRLIALNDLFLSPKYRSCAGKADDSAGAAELAWMRQQLAQARAAGERVWVMGHIPPGIDPYSTLMSFSNVCDGGDPVLFLAEDKLADLLVEYADVVRLGVFGHTHMDEMRVLRREGDEAQGGVAVKLVPSISPVDGNEPSFTIARVNAASGVMEDFQVVSTGYEAGIAAGWAPTYDFGRTYDQAGFTPSAVEAVIAEFKADRGAKAKASQAYLRHYYAGDRAAELSIFWTQYVCALGNYSVKGYAGCVCSSPKKPAVTTP